VGGWSRREVVIAQGPEPHSGSVKDQGFSVRKGGSHSEFTSSNKVPKIGAKISGREKITPPENRVHRAPPLPQRNDPKKVPLRGKQSGDGRPTMPEGPKTGPKKGGRTERRGEGKG